MRLHSDQVYKVYIEEKNLEHFILQDSLNHIPVNPYQPDFWIKY